MSTTFRTILRTIHAKFLSDSTTSQTMLRKSETHQLTALLHHDTLMPEPYLNEFQYNLNLITCMTHEVMKIEVASQF